MKPGDDSATAPPHAERAVFPRSPPPRSPERELRERAKAAKLRHKAASARVKANRLEDRARTLYQKAVEMDKRADEFDRVVRTPVPVNE